MNQTFLDLARAKALALSAGSFVQTVFWDTARGCGCLTGYVMKATDQDPMCGTLHNKRAYNCVKVLVETLGHTVTEDCEENCLTLFHWNDAPERTFAEVVDLLDRAAQRASA